MGSRKPWHILQLVTRGDWGGAQRHVLDLATGLDPERFRVTVACAPDGPLVERLQEQGVTVVPVVELQRDVSPFQDRQALAAITRLIRDAGVDLIHCHSSKAGFLGRLAARRAGVRSVFTAHGFAFAGSAVSLPARAAYLGAEWWAGRWWTDRLITVSEADRRLALAWRVAPPSVVHLVHNGVRPERYAPIAPPALGPGAPVVGLMTRLVPGKGLSELLEAARLLLNQGPYRFVVGGEGPLRAALEEHARRLGIAEHVSFPGFVADDVAFLSQLDVSVLPSYKEGLPYTVLEAMAAGRPVVASCVGGIPEVITDGQNGRLVRPGDVAALARALAETVMPERLSTLSAAARETIRSRFSHAGMVRAIEQVYKSIL